MYEIKGRIVKNVFEIHTPYFQNVIGVSVTRRVKTFSTKFIRGMQKQLWYFKSSGLSLLKRMGPSLTQRTARLRENLRTRSVR
jgi:hypothetical protein